MADSEHWLRGLPLQPRGIGIEEPSGNMRLNNVIQKGDKE